MYNHRFFIIILDSVGIGALPDAGIYGDEGSNTLLNIMRYRATTRQGALHIPHLRGMGLGHIEPRICLANFLIRPASFLIPRSADDNDFGDGERASLCGSYGSYGSYGPCGPHRPQGPLASFGRMAERSAGKDTITGHWEIAGLVLDKAFPTFPQGFPASFIQAFEAYIGRDVLGNEVASGTEIVARLGDEHVRTGYPIVYTSADSVFQVAAHEGIIPLGELMEICQKARDMLTGELGVARVIARPFTGRSGGYVRTGNRRDFSVEPMGETLLDRAAGQGYPVLGIGKISDIFAGRGIGQSWPSHSNQEGMELILKAVGDGECKGIVMANLVDFDMLYGHRNDVEGYGRALEEFDAWLPVLLNGLAEEDVVILTADHGCDPTMPGTDHSREYVPVLIYGQRLRGGVDLGSRQSFADVGQTVAEALGLGALAYGESFWRLIT